MSVKESLTINQAGTIPTSPLGFIVATIRPFWKMALAAILVTVLTQGLGACISFVVGQFVDAVTATTNLEEQLESIRYWGIVFFIYSVVLFTGWRITGLLDAKLLVRQNVEAYKVVMDYVTKHSHSYFINRFAGSVSNKVSNAADGSNRLLEMLLLDALQNAVLVLSLGLLVVTINEWLALVFYFFVVLSIGVNYYLVQWRRPNVIALSLLSSRLRGEVVDLFGNIQAVRQYVRTGDELQKIDRSLGERAEKDFLQRQQAETINVVSNIMALMLTGTLLAGTYYAASHGLASMGGMVLVMIVSFRVAGALAQIGGMINRLVRIAGEVEEGLKDIILPYEIVDTGEASPLVIKDGGAIRWNQVTFEYGENRVFDSFNLTIQPGQRVGLVGSSGAGKSTFVSLLLRQHELGSGTITIDDQDIAKVTQDSLRASIAVVPQEPALFHRTIRENIAYGKSDATDQEVIEVAKKAQAHDFISSLPLGYHTLVGERGIKLSGGQKQRIAIARAMLKEAPILVLDEATSALDSESEVAIQKALHILMAGKTVVAIAHRLSTLREMDRILVLEEGKIIEDGTHETLRVSGGTYQRLWEHQAGGFVGDMVLS